MAVSLKGSSSHQGPGWVSSHPWVMLWASPSSEPKTGGHSWPGSSRAWAGPPLILVQLWRHLLLLPRNPHPYQTQREQKGTHRSGGVSKVNLQVPHGLDDGHDGLDGVAVDHGFVLPALLLRVAILMDDPGAGERPRSALCRAPQTGCYPPTHGEISPTTPTTPKICRVLAARAVRGPLTSSV